MSNDAERTLEAAFTILARCFEVLIEAVTVEDSLADSIGEGHTEAEFEALARRGETTELAFRGGCPRDWEDLGYELEDLVLERMVPATEEFLRAKQRS